MQVKVCLSFSNIHFLKLIDRAFIQKKDKGDTRQNKILTEYKKNE